MVVGDNKSLELVMPLYKYDLCTFFGAVGSSLSNQQRLALFKRCVECLEALHCFGPRGTLHTNIKASNFLLGPPSMDSFDADSLIESLVITDFGFKQRAKETLRYEPIASKGGIGGRVKSTAAYASPEVAKRLRNGGDVLVTRRSDIYSLGMVLGFILTNTEPFKELPTFYKILHAIKRDQPRFDLIEIDNKPPLLQLLYQWCTQPNQSAQPSSCREILMVLKRVSLSRDTSTVIEASRRSQRTVGG